MKEHGITHHDSKGVRQKIGDLQASYNAACDWKKHTGEGILTQDEINGVKTVEAKLPGGQHPSSGSPEPPVRKPPGSAIPSDLPDDPLNDLDNPTPTATSKKNPKKRPSTSGSNRSKSHLKKPKKKKITTEELCMKSMVSKRQADITRAQAAATKVKVDYMKELRNHGLSLEEIKKKVDQEFPHLANMENPDDSSSSSSNLQDSSE
ncbi:hypothetical protein PCASD_15065 [Puccinia coronata f. sp. avenae]|uniref:Uncharacterized protein n=1 Tax=Puccinia coronata f. sp. avenae TaxID=200324 RepID=A0A2N5UAW5_9BASI|nr:hypothetical protein PCASD_15065 [Puccinia coronata f. sp. avenae]